jgi:dolichol-phosphate mannosyltransferase
MFSTLLIVLYALVMTLLFAHATNVRTLIHQLLDQQPFSVLVVDDGSPDGTARIADRLATENPGRVSVLHRGSKDGLGAAYRAGFSRALAGGASRIYQMDADLSHDPEILPALRAALMDETDLAIGSRYVRGGGVVGWPWWRCLLSRGGSLYAGTILGLAVKDLTGGFKGWRRDALEAIRFWETRSSGYAFQIETTYRAIMAGARVRELPIEFTDRERGTSKMGWPIIGEAIRNVPLMRLRRSQITTSFERLRAGSTNRVG